MAEYGIKIKKRKSVCYVVGAEKSIVWYIYIETLLPKVIKLP